MNKPAAVLIGAPGSGKTTVGRLLANHLGVGFRDTDRDIELASGRRIHEILEEEGEAHFRVREREAVRRALSEHRGVLALGGGAVLEESTQRLLRGHTVVHLAVKAEQLAARIGAAETRPLLADDPRGRLRTVIAVRTPIYRRLATYSVAANGPSRAVAGRIAVLLTARAAAVDAAYAARYAAEFTPPLTPPLPPQPASQLTAYQETVR
ncbi:shikimate kinase [Kitasatospora sp. GP82]|uniref:shikimate kinase n=1 Tax=Kitasatospora sp. GP82 TaxID=3035089 RepID=UPI0024748B26|nr:shikimate kinase [Kitasatospora sp. GP82]MDH6123569.1 shikimate kinase [Kitasatospora sp. GP82]